jgi:ankyrin repeat protein
VKSGSIPILELLLKHGWDVNHAECRVNVVLPHDNLLNPDSYLPLPANKGIRKAVKDANLVRWLLEYGADPNLEAPPLAQDVPYNTPAFPKSGEALNAAARDGNIEVFNMLIEYGAVLENSDALYAAASSRNDDSERLPMTTRILELGFDINELDAIEGMYGLGTPLHHAVRSDKMARTDFLIKNGADINKKNQFGLSTLEDARKRPYSRVLHLIP